MAHRPPNPEADPKRRQILQAARVVCGRCGFDAARMEEIAAEAHVSKGTLYRFFESKDDLLLATLLDSYEEGERHARAAVEAGAGARLEGLLGGYADALPSVSRKMNANLQAWGVVARDARLADRLHVALRDIYAERSAELAEALDEGIRSGEYARDTDAQTLVASLLAVLDGVLYRSVFDSAHANPRQLAAAFEALVSPIRAERPARGRSPKSSPPARERADG